MDPLATQSELETHLQRDVEEAGAELALALASGAVRAFCGWDLARETATLQADGDGSPILSLPTLHLVDVTAVTVDDVEVDLNLLDRDRIVWSKKGQLYRASGWPRFCVVSADVVHGYDPVPDLVKLVTLDLAARRLSNPEALVSATVSSVTKTWASSGSGPTLSSLHERLLERFCL